MRKLNIIKMENVSKFVSVLQMTIKTQKTFLNLTKLFYISLAIINRKEFKKFSKLIY